MTKTAGRDETVDAFRGLAVIGMILVNHAPPNGEMYSPFIHAQWTGWTMADAIFPAFLFLVGYSITLSAARTAETSAPWMRIWRRTLLLMLISVVLINFPYYDLNNFRLHGTLFRIAICYLAASTLFYLAPPRLITYTLLAVLALQSALLIFIQAPEARIGDWDVDLAVSIHLDTKIFGDAVSYLIAGPAPQGLIPTLGAIASTLFGLVAGHYLPKCKTPVHKSASLMASGIILLALGIVLSNIIPISKPIWTPSYAIFMAGLSLQILGLLGWLMESKATLTKAKLLKVAGTNALVFFVLAQCVQRILVYGRMNIDGEPIQFRNIIYDHLFAPYFLDKFGSLLYTLVFLSLCYSLIYWLYKQNIFIRL